MKNSTYAYIHSISMSLPIIIHIPTPMPVPMPISMSTLIPPSTLIYTYQYLHLLIYRDYLGAH